MSNNCGFDHTLVGSSTPATRIGRRTAKRRFSGDAYFEPLEQRQLLAGLTIVTHGFGIDGLPGTDNFTWVDSMADAVAKQAGAIGTQSSRFDIVMERLTGSADLLGHIDPSNERLAPVTTDSSRAEYVVALDWQKFDGTLAHDSTVAVALAAFRYLQYLSNAYYSDVSLLSLPIHLIGHSRGASLVAELSRLMGLNGIWVDQATFLDTHPLANDAPPQRYQNVVFADTYWRTGIIDGTQVESAHPVDLRTTGIDHGQVHTYYHGTVDLDAEDVDEGGLFGNEGIDTAWYSQPDTGPRNSVGFNWSRLKGGERPDDGVSLDFGGTAGYSNLSITSPLPWANVGNVSLSTTSAGIGSTVTISSKYQDFDTDPWMTYFVDNDLNPFNSGSSDLGTKAVAKTGLSVNGASFAWDTTGRAKGEYFVGVRIADGTHVRYAYAPAKITLTDCPPGSDLSYQDSRWEDPTPGGNGNGVMEAGESGTLSLKLKTARDMGIAYGTLVSLYPGVATVTQPSMSFGNPWNVDNTSWGTARITFAANLTNPTIAGFLLSLNYKVDPDCYVQTIPIVLTVYPLGWFQAKFDTNLDTGWLLDPLLPGSKINDADNIFESGEEGHVNWTLRNIGNTPATHVQLTLYSTDDALIDVPLLTANYPDMVPGGPAVGPTLAFPGFTVQGLDASRIFTGLVPIRAEITWDKGTSGRYLQYIENNTDGLNLRMEPAPWLEYRFSQADKSYDFGVVRPDSLLGVPGGAIVSNVGSGPMTVSGVASNNSDTTVVPQPPPSWVLQPGESRNLAITLDTTGKPDGALTRFLDAAVAADVHMPFMSDTRLTLTASVSTVPVPFKIPGAVVASDRFDISGGIVVWSENGDIFMYDVSKGIAATKQKIASGPGLINPRISGNLVAWYNTSGRDIGALDLVSGAVTISAVNTTWDEQLIGVDSGRIAFARGYAMVGTDQAYNVYEYDTAPGGVVRQVTSHVSLGNGKFETAWMSWDYGAGIVEWTFGSIDSNGISLMSTKFETVAPLPPAAPPPVSPAVNAGLVAVNDGVGVWRTFGNQQLVNTWNGATGQTPGFDVGFQVRQLTCGNGFAVYSYIDDIAHMERLSFRRSSNLSQEIVIASGASGVLPDRLRMQGGGVAWRLGSDLFVTFLDQPDLAVTGVTATPQAPVEGSLFSVTVAVQNVSKWDEAATYTVELWDGNPTAGGTKIPGQTQTVTGGLLAHATAPALTFNNVTLSPEGAHTLYAVLTLAAFDDAVNNTFALPIQVGDSDTVAPDITDVRVEEFNGNGDGILSSDEQCVVSWLASDASGVISGTVSIDGGSPVSATLTTGRWTAGPFAKLSAGSHTALIRATDGDTQSPQTRELVNQFTVFVDPPVIRAISDDTGTLGDGITSDRTLWVSGTSKPGMIIMIYRDGSPIPGTATADGSGNWAFDYTGTTLSDGQYTFTAKAKDTFNNVSPSSAPFIVTVDSTAPAVELPVIVNDGNVQRSMVNTLTVVFSEPVTVPNDSFSLRWHGGGTVPGVTLIVTNPSNDKKTYLIAFTGPAIIGGSLGDGVYDLLVNAGMVRDAAGNVVAPGVITFYRLFGDSDGDRDVDSLDLARMRPALGSHSNDPNYRWYLDFDSNGVIDGADWAQIRSRLGIILPPWKGTGGGVGNEGIVFDWVGEYPGGVSVPPGGGG